MSEVKLGQRHVDAACSMLGLPSYDVGEMDKPFSVGSRLSRVCLAARVIAEAEQRGYSRCQADVADMLDAEAFSSGGAQRHVSGRRLRILVRAGSQAHSRGQEAARPPADRVHAARVHGGQAEGLVPARLAALVALALLTDGCAPRSHEPEELSVAISCPTPFAAVLEAWESASGEPVPEECRSLDVDPAHAWCSLGRVDDVGSEQHAWIHALSDCVYGETDVDHHRAGLWITFGPGSVETRAWDVVEGCL